MALSPGARIVPLGINPFFAVPQGWYIVTYALAIYHLNLLLAFLTPKIDPAMAEIEADEDEGLELPTKQNDEFRPFIRRLPGQPSWDRRVVVLKMVSP
jgi:hypothetical protein